MPPAGAAGSAPVHPPTVVLLRGGRPSPRLAFPLQASAGPRVQCVLNVSSGTQSVGAGAGAGLGKLREKKQVEDSTKDGVHSLLRSRSVDNRSVDLVTLANLCVDIVLKVPQLPQPSSKAKYSFVRDLSASPPGEVRPSSHLATSAAASE